MDVVRRLRCHACDARSANLPVEVDPDVLEFLLDAFEAAWELGGWELRDGISTVERSIADRFHTLAAFEKAARGEA